MRLEEHDHAWTACDRAALALAADDADDALTCARQALRLCPDHAAARWMEARALDRLGQFEQVLTSLDALQQIDPPTVTNDQAQQLRMRALYHVGRHDLALSLARQRWTANPDDTEAASLLINLHLADDDRQAARQVLEQLIARGHAEPDKLRLLAELCPADASNTAIDALEQLGPAADLTTQRRLAQLCIKADRWADAEAHYRQLLKTWPGVARLWIEAGRLADRRGEAQLARTRLARGLALAGHDDDDADEARTALAVALMHTGHFAMAGRQWWRLARSGRMAIVGWAGLLVCSLAAGRKTAAKRARNFLDAHTSRQERRRMLAGLWREAAGPAAIQHACKTAAHATPPTPTPILPTLLREAAQVMARQVQATPMRADVHFHHAVLETALGDPTTANRAVSCALHINPDYTAAQTLALRLHHQRAA